MEVFRTDKAKFKVIETGEGFLKAEISIARAGVFSYFDGTKIIKEAKLPEDIFSKFTLDSAIGAPVTDNHPEENGAHILVDSNNYKKYANGAIAAPVVDNGQISSIATIYDSALIKKIKNKEQNEASIGFLCEQVPVEGDFNGERYDVKQTNIRINHVALVKEGRAGENIKIYIDKKENTMSKKWTVEGGDASNLLTYRKFDGSSDIQVSKEIHDELQTIKTDAKDKGIENDTLKKEIAGLKETNEKLKVDAKQEYQNQLELEKEKSKKWAEKFDTLEKEIPAKVAELAKETAELTTFAKAVMPDMKFDSMSNKEIKLQVIAKGLPFKEGVKVDSISDEMLNARFDAACELLRKSAIAPEKKEPEGSIKIDANSDRKSVV